MGADMMRVLLGLGVALAMAGAVFWMKGLARADAPVPPSPPDRPMVLADDPADAPPEAPARTREEKRFDRYDRDRDGRVTRDEYLAARRKAFGKLDANADGRLDFEEWSTKTSDRFAKADADQDRRLDRGEFATTKPKRKSRPACFREGAGEDRDG